MGSFAHQISFRRWQQVISKVELLQHPILLTHPTERNLASAVYTQALYKLVAEHYLKPSTILSHISPRDKRIQYEKEEKAKISGFPTAKELRQTKEAADARLKREEEEAEKVGLVSSVCFSNVGIVFL
jgi:hypothetical protein